MNPEFDTPIVRSCVRIGLAAASSPVIVLYGMLSIPVFLFAFPATISGSVGNLGLVLLWLLASFAISALMFSAVTFGRRHFELDVWQVVGLSLGLVIAVPVQALIWSDSTSYWPLIHKAPVIASVEAVVILSVSIVAKRHRSDESRTRRQSQRWELLGFRKDQRPLTL